MGSWLTIPDPAFDVQLVGALDDEVPIYVPFDSEELEPARERVRRTRARTIGRDTAAGSLAAFDSTVDTRVVATAVPQPNLVDYPAPEMEDTYWDRINPFTRGFFTPDSPSVSDVWDAGEGLGQGALDLTGDIASGLKDALPAAGLVTMLVLMMVMENRR